MEDNPEHAKFGDYVQSTFCRLENTALIIVHLLVLCTTVEMITVAIMNRGNNIYYLFMRSLFTCKKDLCK